MTLEEKRGAIIAYCSAHGRGCVEDHDTRTGMCPLFKTPGQCFSDTSKVERNYELLVEAGLIFPPADSTPDPEANPAHEFDPVNRPRHYNREGAMESIDEMVLVFGPEAVMHFCLCNAWKYRYRAADKNGEEDLKKSDWYMRKYKELKEAGHDPT